jgi:hypothetical protein
MRFEGAKEAIGECEMMVKDKKRRHAAFDHRRKRGTKFEFAAG